MTEIKGIISKGVGGTYTVRVTEGELSGKRVLCQIRGGIRYKKQTPAIGDRVLIEESGDPDVPYVLNKILDRKNSLVRPPVANLDYLLLTFACENPEPDLKLLDKMLIICADLDIEPIIIFTKMDLNDSKAKDLHRIYSDCGYKVYLSDSEDALDIDAIKAEIKNGFVGFAGPSGVGKSTLCNKFLESQEMAVGNISDRLKRGKHTTRHVELFDFGDGFLTDTPGFTQLSLFDLGIEYRSVINGYPEMIKLSENCKFDDCRHINERDCSVLEALSEGKVDQGRHARYKEFYEELYNRRNDYSGRKKYD